MRLEWVSELWDDRHGEAPRLVSLGPCEAYDDFEAVWEDLVVRLLSQPTARQVAREVWDKVHSATDADLDGIAAEQSVVERMKSLLFFFVAQAKAGASVFLVEETGAGCVRECHEVRDRGWRAHGGSPDVSMSPVARLRAAEGYRAGAAFVLIDTTDAAHVWLLSAGEAHHHHNPLRVAPRSPPMRVEPTRALLKRARLALDRMAAAF